MLSFLLTVMRSKDDVFASQDSRRTLGGESAGGMRVVDRATGGLRHSAVRGVESITTGLQWRAVQPPVCVTGPPGKADLEACWELGAVLAAEIAGPLPPVPRSRASVFSIMPGRRDTQERSPPVGADHWAR
jgi:hypothetical protein